MTKHLFTSFTEYFEPTVGTYCSKKKKDSFQNITTPWPCTWLLKSCDGDKHEFQVVFMPVNTICILYPMDGGAWWAAAHGVSKSRTRLSNFTFTFHFHALEREMATHSSILAWRIPGIGEPGGLPSTGSHRVGHNWSDLAAASAAVHGSRGHFDFQVLLFKKFHKVIHAIYSDSSYESRQSQLKTFQKGFTILDVTKSI